MFIISSTGATGKITKSRQPSGHLQCLYIPTDLIFSLANRTLASFKVKVAEKLNLSRDGVLSLQHDRGNGVVAPLEDGKWEVVSMRTLAPTLIPPSFHQITDFDYHAFIQRLNVSSTPLQVKVQPLTSVSTGQPPTTTPSPIHPPPHISPALSGESKIRKRSASPPVLNAPVAQTAGDGPRANKKKKKKKKQRNSESDGKSATGDAAVVVLTLAETRRH